MYNYRTISSSNTIMSTALAQLVINISLNVSAPAQATSEERCTTSYGIACVNRNADSGKLEVLMIQKRSTYAFVEFSRGKYKPTDASRLQMMFNQMTTNEKSLIHTKDFHTVWMYSFLKTPTKPSDRKLYSKSQEKFEQLCGVRNGRFLLRLLENSTSSELIWEIPKGRIGKNETILETAVREFEEETGVDPSMYQLLTDKDTVEYTFSDDGVKYKYIYFIACLNDGETVQYDFRNRHMRVEIADLRFLSLNTVFEFNNTKLYKAVRSIFKKVRNYA